MAFTSGTREVGEDATEICGVPASGVRVRNTGNVPVYVGGPDVANDGDGKGYPIEPGGSEDFAGASPKESPVVPAPEGDMDPPKLFARTGSGQGKGEVAFISVSMT